MNLFNKKKYFIRYRVKRRLFFFLGTRNRLRMMLRLPRHKMVRRIPLKASFFHRNDIPLYSIFGGLIGGSMALYLASPSPRIAVPNVIYIKAEVEHPELEKVLERQMAEYIDDLYRCNGHRLVLLSDKKVNHMKFDENTRDKQLCAATKEEESRVV